MFETLLTLILPGTLGLFVGLSLGAIKRTRALRSANNTAERILAEAEAREEELFDTIKQDVEDLRQQLEEELENAQENFEEKKIEIQRRIQSRRARFDDGFQGRVRNFEQHKGQCDELERRVQSRQDKLRALNTRRLEMQSRYTDRLAQQAKETIDGVKTILKEQIERAAHIQIASMAKQLEERMAKGAEANAKRIILIALNRFARPYCDERGIGYVVLSNEDQKRRLFGPDRQNLTIVEQVCGVDLVFNEEYQSLAVSGFDPVRRELARASLEKLVHERDLNRGRIEHIVTKTKRDLFRTIRSDGKRIVQELRLPHLHPEILNMMGALRYRYSFAQNQYFHCGEVGHLCGLLSAEVGVSIVDGRRAGLLHDIGKAMDHSQDGGHAVIGADYISKYNEPVHIVHAVRSHHYDETPNSELAFLVIAADALSGARPGARRSTADSYMQKMGQLEQIGASFDGVQSTYILSAGREVRIYVDSQKVDDFKALNLSKDIARKIEDEVNYPGFIKVTVVRQTQSVQMAK